MEGRGYSADHRRTLTHRPPRGSPERRRRGRSEKPSLLNDRRRDSRPRRAGGGSDGTAEPVRFVEVRRDRGQRHRRQGPVRGRRADDQAACHLPLRAGDHARRQHVRRAVAGRFREEIRTALCRAAQGERPVPGIARQSRSAGERVVQAVQHERSALLHVRPEARPVLRAGQHPHGQEAARLDRGRAQGFPRRVEDLLLPSPAVLGRRPARVVGRSPPAARADFRQIRRRRRLLRPRPRLRACQAAERHLLFGVGRSRPAAKGQHAAECANGRLVRSGPELSRA